MKPPLDLTPYTLVLGDPRVVRKIKKMDHDFITFGLNPTQKAVCGSWFYHIWFKPDPKSSFTISLKWDFIFPLLSVPLRSSTIQEERRETEISSLILMRLVVSYLNLQNTLLSLAY